MPHRHELEWQASFDGGSVWGCRIPNCEYVEFQYEDATCGR